MPYEYIPERGDIVWLNFTPQSGHEQAGKRPAFVSRNIKLDKRNRYNSHKFENWR